MVDDAFRSVAVGKLSSGTILLNVLKARWPAFALFRFVLFGLLNRIEQMGNESKVIGKRSLELR